MRSKEVEKAINDLMFIVVKDIYCNEIRIDKTKIIKEYNESVSTVLDYVRELEEKIEVCTDTGARIISTKFIKNNYINKEILRKLNENTDTYRDFAEEVLKLL